MISEEPSMEEIEMLYEGGEPVTVDEVVELARARVAELEEQVAQLQEALDSRIVIEQAKGILAERLALTIDDAFGILRSAARSNRENIHAVAERVVQGGGTPGAVVVAMARTSRQRAAWMREIAEAHRARVEELHILLHEQIQRLRERAGGAGSGGRGSGLDSGPGAAYACGCTV
jgi:ANTAR domain